MARFLLPVVAAALFLSFFRLGSLTLFDVDEAVFSEATREMVQSGDYITPTYNGEKRYDKPILFYWFMAAAYKIFGVNEFSARFPSAAAAFLTALSLFIFLRAVSDERRALYASLSLILSIYFFSYSHAAVTDMTLTFFISLSLICFFLSTRDDQRPKSRKKFLYGFYLFSALAFLTKGLIGIVFPFGIAIIFLWMSGGLRSIGKAFSLAGVAIFLLVSAPWYAAQLVINGREFVDQFFVKHHFARYTGIISGHKGPFYYYIPVLIIGMFPWTAFLAEGIRNSFKGGMQDTKKDTRSMIQDTADNKMQDEIMNHGSCIMHRESRITHYASLNLFALIWFAFIFIFFSLSTTKLPNYILPAIPAVSILISTGMTGHSKWNFYSNLFTAVIAAAMGVAFLMSPAYILKLGSFETGWTPAAAVVLFAIAGVMFHALFAGKGHYGIMSLLMFAFLCLMSIKAMPLVNQYMQGTLHRYSLYAKEKLRPDEKIVTYGINYPSILFYSGRRLDRVGNEAELMPILGQNRRLLAICKSKETGNLNRLGFDLIESDGKYALLERPAR